MNILAREAMEIKRPYLVGSYPMWTGVGPEKAKNHLCKSNPIGK
jgi:hypothetical protein